MAYQTFIEGGSLSTRQLQLVANNKRSTNSIPADPKTTTKKQTATKQKYCPKQFQSTIDLTLSRSHVNTFESRQN
jgi:hypothetical protein